LHSLFLNISLRLFLLNFGMAESKQDMLRSAWLELCQGRFSFRQRASEGLGFEGELEGCW